MTDPTHRTTRRESTPTVDRTDTSPDEPLIAREREGKIHVNLDTAAPDEALIEEADLIPLPSLPIDLFTRSGRYIYARQIVLPPVPIPVRDPFPIPTPGPLGPTAQAEPIFDEDVNAIALYQREEVMLDVDGRYPQMTISGTRAGFLRTVAHWVASVRRVAPNRYEGPIWYKDGSTSAIPHTFISALVTGGPFAATRKVQITFTGGGAAAFMRRYAYDSAYRRKVEFEYDRVSDAAAVTSIATHAHPNRPAALPNETLTIEKVYRRAGFNASVSAGSAVIPIAVAGGDALWTDQEMHDAMQAHWSRFADKPQWAMWVLFARLHVIGTNLGGIMFDDIGPNHRQGTAIFSHAFIATPPAGDPAPGAWVERMRFWTAVHEMGHAFNLAHSWQKAASPFLPGNPWIPLVNEPEARSFMNYPYFVAGGQAAFFANFAYRFTDAELLFMRHAPERFVQMGNEDWFSNHGFREAALDSNPDFELRLTVNAPDNRFHYLQPAVVEVALANRSTRQRVVSAARIGERSDFTLIINPEGRPAEQWIPHLRHCGEGEEKVLAPGEAIYDSVMAGTGRNGWSMAEPGRYTLQAVLEADGRLVYSNQIEVTVLPPASREEQQLAADFFTPEVGQVLAVNGTRFVASAEKPLAAATELDDNPVAQVAAVALATPLSYSYKLLQPTSGEAGGKARTEKEGGERVEAYPADPEAARKLLRRAVDDNADALVDAVGHTRILRDAPLLAALEKKEVPNSPAAFTTYESRSRAEAAGTLSLSSKLQSVLKEKAAGLTQ